MATYLLLDINNNALNVIEHDGEADWPTPDGVAAVVPYEGPFYSGAHFDGTTLAAPPPPPPTIPQAVSQKQARLALFGAGLLDQVEAAVTAAGGAVKITWDYSDVIERNNPLVITLGQALNLTPAQLDALFVKAATL